MGLRSPRPAVVRASQLEGRRFKRSFGLGDGVEVRKSLSAVKQATVKTVRIVNGETAKMREVFKPKRATVSDAE